MTDDRTAWAAYRALQPLVDARVARDLERESGISMADYEVLEAVCEMATRETCVRVRALGTQMRWAPSRLSRQLGRMVTSKGGQMAAGYYVVNRIAQANGDHEVHLQGCTYFPTSHITLGFHAGCRSAVAQARQTFLQSNGCYWCSNECHTT